MLRDALVAMRGIYEAMVVDGHKKAPQGLPKGHEMGVSDYQAYLASTAFI